MLTPDQRQALLALARRVGELRGANAFAPGDVIQEIHSASELFDRLVIKGPAGDRSFEIGQPGSSRTVSRPASELCYHADSTSWTTRQRQVFESLVAERVGSLLGVGAFFAGCAAAVKVGRLSEILWTAKIVNPMLDSAACLHVETDTAILPVKLVHLAYPSDRDSWTERQAAWFDETMTAFYGEHNGHD